MIFLVLLYVYQEYQLSFICKGKGSEKWTMHHFEGDGEGNWKVGAAFFFTLFPQENTKFAFPLTDIKFSFAWEN